MASPKEASDFSKKVMASIRQIPPGFVATYGQIAALAGKPHGSRGVAWILNSCANSHQLPWQRVLNSQGRISFSVGSSLHKKQKTLLQREGVRFGRGGRLDLTVYQWSRQPRKPRTSAKTPTMFRGV